MQTYLGEIGLHTFCLDIAWVDGTVQAAHILAEDDDSSKVIDMNINM
jgi:hypothetical protein